MDAGYPTVDLRNAPEVDLGSTPRKHRFVP